MKKIIKIIASLLILIPFIKVNALECYSEAIKVDSSFPCIKLNGETLTFKDSTTGEDYKDYFSYTLKNDKKKAKISINKDLKFDSDIEVRYIKISDGVDEFIIKVKNPAYIMPSTTTPTTADINKITYTVTLDPNDSTEKIVKSCTLSGDDTFCSITLPKINKNTFNGWGTAPTCKEGASGTIKVDKNITYYACYINNTKATSTTSSTSDKILLKTLVLTNKETNEKIDFGTFSIKKQEYSFKVLNEVSSINVEATADEGVNIEVSGNENLIVGENEIIIKLTNNENITNEYKLKVEKLDAGETITNVHFLKSLVVGGYNINFNQERFIYQLTIPSDISKLEITPIALNEKDKIEVVGNEDLIDGSSISINVIGEDDETTVYTINIIKESSANYLLYIAIGIIVLLIIVLVVLMIIKSNQKKKNSNNNKPKVLKEDKQESVEVLNI